MNELEIQTDDQRDSALRVTMRLLGRFRPGQLHGLFVGLPGKTTLASLSLRFYDQTAGRITLDGSDLRAVTLKSLRKNVALVTREPILLAASAACAHEFIVALPEQYGTQIAERGVGLSGGQSQRIGLKNAKVVIFDQPTASLDSETEERLLQTFRRLMKRRTALIIAHRLSSVRDAHRVVVLQMGRVAEIGTHQELLAHGEAYARLYRSQFGQDRAALATAP